MRALLQTTKIDVLHKVRSQSFLLMLLAMAILAMIFFPSINATYQTITIGNYRGVYNSAWIGNTLAMLNVSFLPLILFYFIRGAIQHDAASHRGEIFVASRLSMFDYLMGKVLSNFTIGLFVILWMTFVAIFMQLWIGEDRSISLWHLFLPQLIHVVPIVLLISLIALVFDSIPVLRASIGNIAYFFIAIIGLVDFSYEVTGVNIILADMKESLSILHGLNTDSVTVGITTVADGTKINTFIWNGLSYGEIPYRSIGYVMATCVCLFVIAWLSFRRSALLATNTLLKTPSIFLTVCKPFMKLTKFIHFTIRMLSARNVFLNLTRQEFLLLTGNKSPYLWLAILGLWIAQWFVPISIVLTGVMPALLLLGSLVLSSLGQRERNHGTQDFLINAPLLLKVQYPAMVFAGVLFLSTISLPSLIILSVSGQIYGTGLLIAGYFCIVSLAILLGTLSGTNKAFEIIFVIVWYMGPMSHFTYFDFIGVDPQLSEQINAATIFLCAGLIFSTLGVFIRKRFLL